MHFVVENKTEKSGQELVALIRVLVSNGAKVYCYYYCNTLLIFDSWIPRIKMAVLLSTMQHATGVELKYYQN